MNLSAIDPFTVILIVSIVVIALSVGLVFSFAGSDVGEKYITFLTPITVALIGILTAAQNARNHQQNQDAIHTITENSGDHTK